MRDEFVGRLAAVERGDAAKDVVAFEPGGHPRRVYEWEVFLHVVVVVETRVAGFGVKNGDDDHVREYMHSQLSLASGK
jgi:hypothetical protein